MARPLSTPDAHRGGSNGRPTTITDMGLVDPLSDLAKRLRTRADFNLDQLQDNDRLRAENGELRALCCELEQALQEASQQNTAELEMRWREAESMVEEKTETIRNLHQQLQEAQATLQDVESQASRALEAAHSKKLVSGPVPREDELLALSEELERERRQLQEDEQALMEQMREMEVGMAKERAEMARQRNDLQRLQAEIRHELERLEKSGAMQTKIDGLKSKLHDATTRRGAAHGAALTPSGNGTTQVPTAGVDTPVPEKKKSLMGKFFGGGKK